MIVVSFGPPAQLEAVAAATAAHASWLGRPLNEQRHDSEPGPASYAAWDPDQTDDANRLVVICRDARDCRFRDRLGDAAARVRLHVHLSQAELDADVALAAPVQLFHARLSGGAWLLADDLRLLRRLVRPELDEVGVFSLLRWGSVPAPMTPFRAISRVVPGTVLRYEARTDRQTVRNAWRERVARLSHADRPRSPEEGGELLISAFDRALAAAPAGSVVSFSAGVDSPLLAWRLVANGATDTTLVHMSFADAPAETTAAGAIARHLELTLREIAFDAGHIGTVLSQAGRWWPFPVGNASLIAGQQLFAEALSANARGIVDGSSGGTADTRRSLWQRATSIPPPISATAARLHRGLGLWPGEGGRVERVLRAASRGHGLRLPAAALTQNSLDGICYRVPAGAARAISTALASQAAEMPGGAAGAQGFVVASAVHHGAARWSTKFTGPAWSRGMAVVLPSLTEAVVEAKLAIMATEWGTTAGKTLQRLELLRRLPRELVHRPKHAFMSPMQDVVATPELRSSVEGALAPGAPLADLLLAANVRRLLALIAEGRRIGDKQAGFLWTVAFVDHWLRDTDLRSWDSASSTPAG